MLLATLEAFFHFVKTIKIIIIITVEKVYENKVQDTILLILCFWGVGASLPE